MTDVELAPGTREIVVAGELDLAVADQLKAALEECRGHSTVLINLDRCDFIDSTGIAVIVFAHQRLLESGGRVAVFAPNDQVQRVLGLTGLTGNGLVFKTRDDALDESVASAGA